MLTSKQREAILSAKAEDDYCIITHKRTMHSLETKGFATYTNGFGFRFGAIIQLTEKGKQFLKAEKSKQLTKLADSHD